MANIQSILGGLLVGQLALAALTWWPAGDGAVELKKLIPGGANGVTKVSITRSGEGAELVELSSKDGHWFITSKADYPADDAKVAEMVDALAKIELGNPVVTQKESFAKLKVDDKEFGKKVVFTADGAEHTLLIGAAKSKSIYLRLDGSDDVYLVKGPSEFVFKDAAKSLWKTNYVEFDKDGATTFAITNAGTTWSFKKDGETWKLENAPEGMQAKSSKVAELVGKASALRLGEPAGKDPKPEFGLEAGIKVDYTATAGEGTTSGSFVIGAEHDGKRYVFAQGNPFIAQVPSYVVKEIVEATPETLLEPAGGGAPEGIPGLPEGMQMMPPQ